MSDKSDTKHACALAQLRSMARVAVPEKAHELRASIAVLEADAAAFGPSDIDRVICDHGHVSDQVRDLQRAVLLLVEMMETPDPTTKLVVHELRRLVAHEVGRHTGEPIQWIPKRESPFRAPEDR